MKKNYIETGKIVGTHGIVGEMRVQPWADSPEVVAKLKRLYIDEQGTPLKNISTRVHGNVVLLKVEGVSTIEAAERLRGKIVYAAREDVVPQGRFLIADIIGCKVFDADDNTEYGVLSDVSQTGANDVWHIEKCGREYLIPAVKEVVASVDVDNQTVLIRPIKGIFDDEN